jgi:hypothetical protein
MPSAAANPIVDVVRTAVADLKDEAARRRKITRVDPVADTLEHVASDLLDRLKQAELAHERLTPEQYAALPQAGGAAVQTVRKWCRLGRIPGAELTDSGWRIPRGATRVRATRTPATAAGGARGNGSKAA